MLGFEITHNGKKSFLAGDDCLESISAVIAAYGKLGKKASAGAHPFGNLSVFGIAGALKEGSSQMLTWEDDFPLKVGDTITIRFVEIAEASRPKKIEDVADEESEA